MKRRVTPITGLDLSRYLIMFDDGAMTFPEEELPDMTEAAHKVVEEAKNADIPGCSGPSGQSSKFSRRR